jgi:hypothetical protein
MQQKKTVLDGTGADNPLLLSQGFPATVVVTVSAGVCDVEYSCDKDDDIRADPVTGITWLPWDFGQVVAGTPGVNSLVAPITALRVLPVGGNAQLNVVGKAP